MSAASSDVIASEPAREDISASGQKLQFDMNEMNGHIKQRKGRIGIITSLPRLLRPKPSNDVTSQGPALNGSAASAQTEDGRVKFLSSPALASSETEKLETSLTSPLKLVAEMPSKIAEHPAVNFVKDLPEMVKEIPVVAEFTTVVAELPAKAVLETAQILKEQVVDPVVEVLPDEVVEQVSAVVEKVASLQTQVSGTVSRAAGEAMDVGQNIVDQVTEGIHDSMIDHNNSLLRLQQQVCTSVCTIKCGSLHVACCAGCT